MTHNLTCFPNSSEISYFAGTQRTLCLCSWRRSTTQWECLRIFSWQVRRCRTTRCLLRPQSPQRQHGPCHTCRKCQEDITWGLIPHCQWASPQTSNLRLRRDSFANDCGPIGSCTAHDSLTCYGVRCNSRKPQSKCIRERGKLPYSRTNSNQEATLCFSFAPHELIVVFVVVGLISSRDQQRRVRYIMKWIRTWFL